MNTTDIRDTGYDQKIFWTAALPVTLGVLALAFLYGYKWDLILTWVSRSVKSPDRSAISNISQNQPKLSWMTAMEQKTSGAPKETYNTDATGWKHMLAYRAGRRRRSKNRVLRQKTDDSLFRP